MDHLERTFVEILRRIDDLERNMKTVAKTRRNIVGASGGTTIAYANDHRFLENLNSDNYHHITRAEYDTISTLSNDHGLLDGLNDDDHKQYIRHALAIYDWDILAGNANRTFERKSIDQLRNKLSEKLFPETDGIQSVMFYKSDGVTPVVTLDTSNSRVGIGIQPQSSLHISGDETITSGNLIFVGNTPSAITATKDISIISNEDILFDADSIVINGQVQASSFASDVYGWQLMPSGDAEFRNIRVNKINARIVATGVEQFVGGRQTMCKSASPLSSDFTIPAPESEATLRIEPFADYPLVNVFDNGDIVRISYTSLFDGEYNTSECWGSVVISASSSPREQTYTFTRSAAPNSGDANAGLVVAAGELVLNYGSSGMGYIVSTVV
jgi:hypothetical protein